MKEGKGDFEIVKENKDDKGNYIFQKDKITKGTTAFVVIALVVMVIAVIATSFFI